MTRESRIAHLKATESSLRIRIQTRMRWQRCFCYRDCYTSSIRRFRNRNSCFCGVGDPHGDEVADLEYVTTKLASVVSYAMASEYREEHSKPTPAGSYNETNKIENRALQPASTNGYTIEENEGVNGLEDSDADADGEDVDNLETNSTAVRIESGNNILRDDKATQSDANEMLSQRKKGHSSDRHSNSSVSESEADQEWEGKSESSADGGDEIVNGNRCMYVRISL